MLCLLKGKECVQIREVREFGRDGAGTGAGFGIFSRNHISAQTDLPMVCGVVIPIPQRVQVLMTLSKDVIQISIPFTAIPLTNNN